MLASIDNVKHVFESFMNGDKAANDFRQNDLFA